MMKVSITNKGNVSFDVPVTSLIANAQPPSLALEPGATGDVKYIEPPVNHEVARALETWAAANGYEIALAFAPNPPGI